MSIQDKRIQPTPSVQPVSQSAAPQSVSPQTTPTASSPQVQGSSTANVVGGPQSLKAMKVLIGNTSPQDMQAKAGKISFLGSMKQSIQNFFSSIFTSAPTPQAKKSEDVRSVARGVADESVRLKS